MYVFDYAAFLNQIKNNYSKRHSEFADDFIELLKFINMKCKIIIKQSSTKNSGGRRRAASSSYPTQP